MDMPERSFGRTVRYRRTKLGLSQAKLAELVGRTTPTIRSWERDKSRPNDAKVLSALAAILGIDEGHLFDKAGVERPEAQTSPTVEQALATLSIPDGVLSDTSPPDGAVDSDVEEERFFGELESLDVVDEGAEDAQSTRLEERDEDPGAEGGASERRGEELERELASESSVAPAFAAPPDPYQQTPLTPTLADISYMEDGSQRQLYRVRTLATLVAIVALVIAFIWAVGEGLGALGAWWNDFFGNLRL